MSTDNTSSVRTNTLSILSLVISVSSIVSSVGIIWAIFLWKRTSRLFSNLRGKLKSLGMRSPLSSFMKSNSSSQGKEGSAISAQRVTSIVGSRIGDGLLGGGIITNPQIALVNIIVHLMNIAFQAFALSVYHGSTATTVRQQNGIWIFLGLTSFAHLYLQTTVAWSFKAIDLRITARSIEISKYVMSIACWTFNFPVYIYFICDDYTPDGWAVVSNWLCIAWLALSIIGVNFLTIVLSRSVYYSVYAPRDLLMSQQFKKIIRFNLTLSAFYWFTDLIVGLVGHLSSGMFISIVFLRRMLNFNRNGSTRGPGDQELFLSGISGLRASANRSAHRGSYVQPWNLEDSTDNIAAVIVAPEANNSNTAAAIIAVDGLNQELYPDPPTLPVFSPLSDST